MNQISIREFGLRNTRLADQRRRQVNHLAAQKPGNSVVFVFRFLVICLLLAAVTAACGPSEKSEGLIELELKLTKEAVPDPVEATATQKVEPTQQSEETAVAEEAPAAGSDQQASEPVQTTTAEAPVAGSGEQTSETVQGDGSAPPTPDSELQEAGATATARALELEATSIAAAQVNEASQSATVAALAPIHEELARLGINPNEGVLGFTHPPITLEVTDFENSDFANQNLFTVAGDFVLAADITWESQYAESGCGFVVRSDGDEEAPSQYIIGLTRGAEGHVLFAEQVEGSFDLRSITDIYANGIDPLFEWQSGTTNRIVVIGRDQEFTIFSNGTRIGSVNGRAGLEEGFVAFIAINRSGGIKCDYDNAWLWKID